MLSFNRLINQRACTLCVIWWYSLLDNVRSHIITIITCLFPGRVLARISILLRFKPRKHFENIMSFAGQSAYANKAKTYWYFRYRNHGQDTSGKNGTYGHPITTTFTILLQKIYCISNELNWVENESSVVVRALVCTWAKVFLRV